MDESRQSPGRRTDSVVTAVVLAVVTLLTAGGVVGWGINRYLEERRARAEVERQGREIEQRMREIYRELDELSEEIDRDSHSRRIRREEEAKNDGGPCF
jgi:hypothetical protein